MLQAVSIRLRLTLWYAAVMAVTLVGVGGVFDGDDVWDKLKAGATLVQAYTGFIYEGPLFVRKALRGLKRRMQAEGIVQLEDIIGVEASKY